MVLAVALEFWKESESSIAPTSEGLEAQGLAARLAALKDATQAQKDVADRVGTEKRKLAGLSGSP